MNINAIPALDRENYKTQRLNQLENEAFEKANKLLAEAWELARGIAALQVEAEQFNTMAADGYEAHRMDGKNSYTLIEDCKGYNNETPFTTLWKIGDCLETIAGWAKQQMEAQNDND